MTVLPQSSAPLSASDGPQAGFWSVVRESLRGSRQDLTRAPLGRAVLLLAVPMVMEMVMESVFAVVDVFWVGKLGADAVATVGLTESLLSLIYAMAMGLSMGAGAVVARRMGEGDQDGAARASVQAIALGLGCALIVATAGALSAPHLLGLMGASPSTLRLGGPYARVMLASSVPIMLLFVFNAIFRGAGDAALSMRTLWLANLLNIALGPCFIFGWGPFPRLGVTGAAVATTMGRSVGVLYQVSVLAARKGRLVVKRSHLAFDGAVMSTIVRIARGGVIQVLIGTASWVGLVRILSDFGSSAIAGYTIAIRIVLFALLPSFGMANAAATLVGQNLGAQQPDRAEAAVWRASQYNVVFLGSVGVLFFVLAGPIIHLFSTDPAVAAYGTSCLRLVSLGFPFYAYGLVVIQAFNGAGDTRTPTLVNFLCFWVFEMPLAWFLSHALGWGPTGGFAAVAGAFSLVAVLGVLLFRRGRWKQAVA